MLGLLCILAASATYDVVDVTIGAGTPDQLAAKRLLNHATGEFVEVIHTQGGRIEQVFLSPVSSPSKPPRDVIQTHLGNATEIRQNPHWAGEMLSPFANRIAK